MLSPGGCSHLPDLVKEAQYLACNVLATSLFVVYNSRASGEDNIAELTGGQEVDNPFLKILQLNIESWGNHSSLIQSSIELDDNLAIPVIVDLFELSDISLEIISMLRKIKRCASGFGERVRSSLKDIHLSGT